MSKPFTGIDSGLRSQKILTIFVSESIIVRLTTSCLTYLVLTKQVNLFLL